jgi:long-subunit fatty acid transport protein
VTIRSLALALISCALAMGAYAQEQASDAPRAAGAAPEAEPAKSQPPAPATGAAPSTPRAESGSERFEPSEDISEDLSVSFPADI